MPWTATSTLWTGSFPLVGASGWLSFFFLYFIQIHVSNENNVDCDQTPQNAVSDLGLHCLPVSF